MNGEINWSQPIEAVHEDGRTRGVYLGGEDKNPDNQGDYYTLPAFDGSTTPDVWKADGATWFGCHPGWRIRNVATPPADARTAPSGGEVGPEVVEIAKITQSEAEARGELCGLGPFGRQGYVQCLRDFGLILPEPVDADLVEARKILSDAYEAGGQLYLAARQTVMAGNADDEPRLQAVLLGIKRGRALEKEAGR